MWCALICSGHNRMCVVTARRVTVFSVLVRFANADRTVVALYSDIWQDKYKCFRIDFSRAQFSYCFLL